MSDHIDGILKLLSARDYKPVSDAGIRRHLGIKRSQIKSFYKDLKKLKRQGKINKIGKNRYVLAGGSQLSDVIAGVFKKRNGRYFVENSDGEFLLPKLINPFYAVVGDEVVVVIEKRKFGFAARILKVFKRKYKTIVGHLRKKHGLYIVEPIDRKVKFSVSVGVLDEKKVKEGDVVLCEITRYPYQNAKAAGKILEIYGDELDSSIDEKVVVGKYNLPYIFSDDVIKEAEFCKEPQKNDFKDREDFRDFETITIDGADAKDFDDAVDIEQIKNGFRLCVHIADVSEYVKQNSALDKEAFIRGFSVYFPGSVIPMLPHKLSDNICSLVPDRDRLALSVIMDISKKGEIKKYKFVKSVIRNKNRMTYQEVEDILSLNKECDEGLKKRLYNMKQLALILRKRRFANGSIDLNIPEAQFSLKDKEVIDVKERPRLFSHFLIEEFMLAANLCSADFLSKHWGVFIRRIHDEPDAKKINTLSLFLKRFGIKHSFDKNKITSKQIQKLLEDIEDENRKKIVSYLILRSLKRAEYSIENRGHFALGFDNYTHFTSPIRRYPDLVNHRMIKAALSKKNIDIEGLGFIASGVRDREIVTEEAEFYMDDIKSAAFMHNHIGDEFEGVIVSIISSGIFVRLDRFFVEGFVAAERIEDDYYEYYEELFAMIGRRKKRVFRLGDRVKVKVVAVNKFAGEVDFVFV